MNKEQEDNYERLRKGCPGFKPEVYQLLAKGGYTCRTFAKGQEGEQ